MVFLRENNMCLVINKRVKLPKVQKDGYCIGYKVISNMNDSVYQVHQYTIGLNRSTRMDKRFDEYEVYNNRIERGFHIFLRLRTATDKMYRGISRYRKLIKVFFKPEDVVALGTWQLKNSSHNVVVTKMFIKSLDHICKGE